MSVACDDEGGYQGCMHAYGEGDQRLVQQRLVLPRRVHSADEGEEGTPVGSTVTLSSDT